MNPFLIAFIALVVVTLIAGPMVGAIAFIIALVVGFAANDNHPHKRNSKGGNCSHPNINI